MYGIPTLLLNFTIRDKLPYDEELKAMATVKRFDMAIMFLAREDKQSTQNLLYSVVYLKLQEKYLAYEAGIRA